MERKSRVSNEGESAMTEPQRELLAFIELNRLVAIGTLRDCFPSLDIGNILSELESMGLVTKETRPTVSGQQDFYSIKQNAPAVNP